MKLRKLYEKIIPYETRLQFYKWRHPDEYRMLRSTVYPSDGGDFSLKPFDQYQAIFVHITKTAGTSVAKSLFGYLPYHYTATQYRVIYGKKTFNDYFKFAFVRNPWDRVYSSYRYLKGGGWNEKDKVWGETHLSKYSDFNDFVMHWLTVDNTKKHIHFKPQHEFIYDGNGSLIVDFVAYFETLDEDFRYISSCLNIQSSLEQHNTNPGSCYIDIYSTEAKEIVESVYKKDINLFGYEFDGIKNRLKI